MTSLDLRRRPARDSARSLCRGFSTLELMIAGALLLVALALAAGLLVESQRLIASAGRELRRPALELPLRLLRADLTAGVPVGSGGFPGEPLVILRDGRRIVWALDGEKLERRVEAEAGTAEAGLALLDDVLAFAWSYNAGLVEVQIVHRGETRAFAVQMATPHWYRRERQLELLRLAVAPRTGG